MSKAKNTGSGHSAGVTSFVMSLGPPQQLPPGPRVRCFFDFSIGSTPAGRVIFELYNDKVPKTVENFRALCTGEKGIGKTTNKKLHYEGSIFHRVIKGFMIQGGDFSRGDGTGGESIYGGNFEDEAFPFPHDRAFLLSMANCGPNSNGSQFFITTNPAEHLNKKHVVFGCVVDGQDVIRKIENVRTNQKDKPLTPVLVSKSGELVLVKKKEEDIHEKEEKEAKKKSKKKAWKIGIGVGIGVGVGIGFGFR